MQQVRGRRRECQDGALVSERHDERRLSDWRRTSSNAVTPIFARFRSFSWSSPARSAIEVQRSEAKARRLILREKERAWVSTMRWRREENPEPGVPNEELESDETAKGALRALISSGRSEHLEELKHNSPSPARTAYEH